MKSLAGIFGAIHPPIFQIYSRSSLYNHSKPPQFPLPRFSSHPKNYRIVQRHYARSFKMVETCPDVQEPSPKIPRLSQNGVSDDGCAVARCWTHARIAPRSGLAMKHSIDIGAGLIEANCRGPVGVQEPSPKNPKLSQNGASDDARAVACCFLKVKKLSENAVLPSRASALAAGYDLSSAVDAKVPARGKALIPTDLSIAIPQGTYARIAPRSGLALKHSIDVGAGVVDADYRGPVGVILFNHSDIDFEVKAGDRIAQMILEKIVTPDVAEVDDLDETGRGEAGFGSTGV